MNNPPPAAPGQPAYKPASRRPIADIFRRTAGWAVTFCVRSGIHPDVISYLSIAAAALAGLCFCCAGRHPILLLVGPLFCYLRLWCNMLDGMVALASGKASCRGEILNDLPDRISDVLIFAGVAHSGLSAVVSGYWAAIFALLTAYVGLFGQAVGVQREFSGLMSKPWRMIWLHAGAWITFAFLHRGNTGIHWRGGGVTWDNSGIHWENEGIRWGRLTVLDWTCVVVIAGCVQTIWVRLARIMRALQSKRET